MNRRQIPLCDTSAQNSGECLLRLATLVSFLIRHGSGLDEVVRALGIGPRTCQLAMSFQTAPDLVKLRALVEDWNVLEIRSEIRTLHELPAC